MRNLKNTIFVFLLVATAAFAGDTEKELARIAAIPNSVERLAAYDALTAKLGLAPSSKVSTDTDGKWRLVIDTSPVDDSQTVTGILLADAPTKTGYREDGPALILRYREGKISAFVGFDMFLGSGPIEATVRFGKNAAETQSWSVSTDKKSAFVPGDAATFIRQISEVDSFLIRVIPYNKSAVTASFSTTGVEKIKAAIKAAIAKNQN